METIEKPSKREQKLALESYQQLNEELDKFKSDFHEIELGARAEKIKVPRKALQLLAKILEETAKGRAISIVPQSAEMTTQSAAEFLGCSRPHLIQLLEKGEIPFTKVGRHRRIKFQDLQIFKKKRKEQQKKLLIEIMQADEASGLYDS